LKKNLIRCLPLILLFGGSVCQAQKVKSEDIPYFYNRIPSSGLNKSVKNYQIVIDAAYEAKNKDLLKEYEQQKRNAVDKYNKDLQQYPALVKAAEASYAKELAEYNKTSLGSKLLLNTAKPVKHLPYQPYLATVQPPVLQASYDYTALAGTYINLEGYQKATDNALKIVVTLYGFDHTVPRNIDEQTESLSLGGSNNGLRKETMYHAEFSYRHPMTVKVFSPDGKEVLNVTPPELNTYKIYKSAATGRTQTINTDLLVKTSEEKILQDNLKFINNLLNDKYGYSKVKRTATLYYIKNGDEGYTDLTTAFNEASSALLMLQQDSQGAKTRLDKACTVWKTALDQADISNKKARINKDVAIAVSFDLLESYFALGNVSGGQAVLDRLNTISLSSSERKTKYDFDVLFAELKSRQQSN
jgi:hypothetical protein